MAIALPKTNIQNKQWTDAEFMALPKDGHHYELVNGELVEKCVLVYHSPQPDPLLRLTDTLDGEELIPGFSMPVSELFQDWNF